MVYGMLTDARIELGNYDDAEKSAQWMLDLRPGNIPALTRAAYLRELFGDIEGAIELMQAAFGRMPYQETEDRAWVLTQIGHLELIRQHPADAERALEQALDLFPNYHYALGALAEVRTAQKRHREAADLQRRRYAAAPHPENLYELAEAQARAGMTAEAAQSYAQFETGARREMRSQDNANRELVSYLVGAGKKPAEGLALAQQEVARRQDVYTREAYAWALFKNGRRAEARKEIAAVLAVGVQHPRVLERAALIQGKAACRRRRAATLARARPRARCRIGQRVRGRLGLFRLSRRTRHDRHRRPRLPSSRRARLHRVGGRARERSRRAHRRVERGHAALRRPATSPAPCTSTGPPTSTTSCAATTSSAPASRS